MIVGFESVVMNYYIMIIKIKANDLKKMIRRTQKPTPFFEPD